MKSSVVHKLIWPQKKLLYSQWPDKKVHGLSIYLGYGGDVHLCVYQQNMDSGLCKILKIALPGGHFGAEYSQWITTYMTDRKFGGYTMLDKKLWCKQLKIFYGHDVNINDLLSSFISIYSQFSKDVIRIERKCISMGIINSDYVSLNLFAFVCFLCFFI